MVGPPSYLRLRDPEAFANKEPGWQEWLAKFGILDGADSEDDAYERYLKFRGVTFPLVPEAQWHRYFRDLVHLEACFVVGEALGHAVDYPFHFRIFDDRPIKQKPIIYPPATRAWLRTYM